MDKLIIGVVGILLVMAIPATIHYTTKETISLVHIEDKERISNRDGDSKYLIWTVRRDSSGELENFETFENSDSYFSFKFNSSDVYGHIKINDVCTFKVAGLRIKFLSAYRNILSAECKEIMR